MIKRTPQDQCLLCNKNTSDFKGSHLVPAGLIKTMIGKRYSEEGYVIQPDSDDPIRAFFGRDNLKNTDTTIYPNEFVADYVFCTRCENRLGVVENEILPFLSQKYIDPNQSVNFPVTNKGDYKIIKGIRINQKHIAIFLYGVALRMSIQYWLQTGHQLFLRQEHHELIRNQLDKTMGDDIASFRTKSQEFASWPYLFVSCREWKKQTKNVVVPHPGYINPYCFWMDEFLFIFSFSIESLLRFRGPSELGIEINDGSAINQNNTAPIFIDVPSKSWDHSNGTILRASSEDLKMKRIETLAKTKGISMEKANHSIHELAKKNEKESGKGYAFCFNEAFKTLMKQ